VVFPQLDDGLEEIFWHLTHREDDGTGERMPDLRRCERLPWVSCIINNATAPELLFWDYKEHDGSIKTYIWLRDHDFVVILKKYPNGNRRLITSFCVDHASTRRNLERKYKKRL
jgi:hypothetical protein